MRSMRPLSKWNGRLQVLPELCERGDFSTRFASGRQLHALIESPIRCVGKTISLKQATPRQHDFLTLCRRATRSRPTARSDYRRT